MSLTNERSMKNTIILLLAVVLYLFPTGMEAQNPSSIKETVFQMNTYPFSDPNPVPMPENLYYPYFRFDGYTDKSIMKDWKVVEMENDYIKLTLFPEIGGKIWGAVEKTTNKEFIYSNHVVKFRDIAMRGAWTSGGIEFNYGIIGHAPTTSSPVDYLLRTNEDGSVSCFISSIELITRTSWSVEVNLPKDKAYFTTRMIWYNGSSIDQPYYQWTNAGFKASGNLEFCYPGQYYIGHEGDVHSFPKDESGREISWYDKNNFGGAKSYHVLGKYNDFYGAYWHDDNFGSVHYAPYDDKLGMKIFLWGLSRSGAIWEDLLTDSDGQYVELQSGRMFNQPTTNSSYSPYKHFAFLPQVTDSWEEYWFPVKDTEGLSKVSPLGTLSVIRKNNKVEMAFCALQKIISPITVYAGDSVLYKELFELDVLETWKKSIELNDPTLNLKVVIGDNELIWSDTPEDNNLNRPVMFPENFDWNSVYGKYVNGEQLMNQKMYTKAEKMFRDCLQQDPYYLPALIKMASLCYRTSRYNDALSFARQSLSMDTYNGEANYLYGLINKKMDNLTDAKDGFSVASYSQGYKTSAYSMLAQCFLYEKNWQKAIHYASKSLESNPKNFDAIQSLLVAYRYSGNNFEAKKLIASVEKELPLNHYLRYEACLQSNDPDRLKVFSSMIRSELPFETYQEIGGWYEAINCTEEAFHLFSLASDHPIALYRSAFILNQLGKEADAKEMLKKAELLSPDFVFPFRSEELNAFEWAVSETNSWKSRYYTALLYWSLGNKDQALNLLNKCNESSYAPLYLCRAMLKSGQDKLADIQKAEELEQSYRTGLALINYYLESNEKEKAEKIAQYYFRKFPENYVIGLKYAKTLCVNAKYVECIAVLKRLKVLPNEGAYEGRAVYREANLYQAINLLKKKQYSKAIRFVENSKIWIENLGVGKPYDSDIDECLENYILASAYFEQGNPKKADVFYKKVIEKANYYSGSFNLNELIIALSICKAGDVDRADRMVQEWNKKQPDEKVVQWSTAIYKGEVEKARKLLDEIYNVNDNNFTIIVYLLQ